MMGFAEDFLKSYDSSPPDYLPKPLKERLTFLSSLAHKKEREVYLVMDKETEQQEILKITKPESPDSGKREYELLKKLDHPSIPKAILYCEDGNGKKKGREYLLREYLPGDTLDRVLERDGVFDTYRTLEIIKKLCEILSYLHSQHPPVIYKDIKPQNIVTTTTGQVSLIDFGISREDGQKSARRGHGKGTAKAVKKKDRTFFDTVVVGNRPFAAPEMFGFSNTDSRTDIYMLGRLMMYLSTGEVETEDALKKMEPGDLRRICRKCTEQSKEKRYRSVEKLAKHINRVMNPPTRREIAVGTGVAVVVVSFALLGWSYWMNTEETGQTPPLISANGAEYEQEARIPVTVQTVWGGQPYNDCVVSADNHYWFQPTEGGMAELSVYAFDDYKLRAASGNRTAIVPLTVDRDSEDLRFVMDIAATPEAPEYISIELQHGQAHEILLDVSGADEITIQERPAGVSVEKRNGQFYLVVVPTEGLVGHHYLWLEASNDAGKADMSISLAFASESPVVVINSAEDLDRIRDNMSGSYVLGADIDMSGIESWTPIGSNEVAFSGVFDGAGHSITGLTIRGKESVEFVNGGLFGIMENGTVRNVIIREADLYTAYPAGVGYGCVVGMNRGGLIESCAVFNSTISADVGLDSGVGGICGINYGVVKSSWSETEITVFTIGSKGWSESTAGGVCGANRGFLVDSGNTGDITSISLAGGVTGLTDAGITTRCYNAGYVQAPAYFDNYLPGGITHLLGRGEKITYCAFEEGTAQLGASVFNRGTLLGIVPMPRASFRDASSLADAFLVTAGELAFGYASLDTEYPLPLGIFRDIASLPTATLDGRTITVAAAEGMTYYYTTDGTDPRMAETEGVNEFTFTLQAGQTLRVFAAKAGCYDSEIVEYTA